MTTKTITASSTIQYNYNGSGVTLVNAGVEGAANATGVTGPNEGVAIYGSSDTLINNGSIFAYNFPVYSNGSGNTFINAAGAKIAGTGQGVAVELLEHSATVINYGVINAFSSIVSGNLAGHGVAIAYGGLVSNSGSITGGILMAYGVENVINSGVILGNAYYGAINLRNGGRVTNQSGGRISANGATTGYLGVPAYGITISRGAGTIINAGTIIGGGPSGTTGFAVELSAGFQNRLIVDPNAVFTGTVNGGTAVDATLELASGASTGTLSGFGTQFTNFGTVTLDPSASWLIKASTAVTAATINGFAANDTIDLAGFVAVSRTFASNQLVLTNAGNAHVTLHIPGSLSTSDFTLGSDGSGGTDILFGAGTVAALAYGQTIDEAGIVATSETVAAGTMTLFNGASPVGTVAVGSSLSSGDFVLRSDGAGGTDVIVNTVFGTYTTGVTLLANPTTIAGTAKITGSLGGAVGVAGPSGTAWTLTNQGLVSETGANSYGVSLASAGTVVNAATIAGDQAGIVLVAGGSVTNQSGGTISGFYAVEALSGLATVVNAGVIAGSYTTNNADGVYLQAGGSVTNQSTGRITGDNNGIRIAGASGTVVNLGTVQSNDIPGQNGGAGIYLANGGAVTNGGSGGTASTAYILGYHYGVAFGASAAGTLTNFGTISGNPGNPAVVLTSGTIINGPSGATAALIEGGDQTHAVLVNGVGTVINYAKIIGVENPGDTGLYYGIRLGGAAGRISNLGGLALIENYIGVYATDNDTIINAGTIASNYAGGHNALVFGGGTNRLIIDPGAKFIGTVSGSGPVTLAPSGNTQVIGTANGIGTTTLELASASNAGTLHGLGVQYVGFGQVTVDSGAAWTLAGTSTLAAGQTLTNAGTLSVGGTLTNAGRITGAAKGIVLATGARFTNQSGGTIATGGIAVSASGAATVVNAGLIGGNPTLTGDNGVYLAAGGSVTNQTGGTISGDIAVYARNAAATLSNAGSIAGSTLSNGDGVAFRHGGSVSNQSAGTISGHYGIYFATGTAATLSNAGRIFGNTGIPIGAGVFVGGGGTVTNLSGGTIAGQTGVYAENVAATVVNAGSIAGNPTGGTGVYLQAGGSLTNQSGGSISGGADAVKFAAGHTGRLAIDPGAGFTGSVDGGNTIGAAAVSTLELASGTGTATLSGLGTQFIDFAQVTVDAGAAWTLSGTATGFATLTNAGRVSAGVTLGAGSFTVSNQSAGTIIGGSGLYALGAVTVANAGSIAGNVATGSGIVLTAGGSVTNQSGGTISGKYGVEALSVAATVVNAGGIGGNLTIGGGVNLGAGGAVTNQAGGTITGLRGVIATFGSVVNAGNISGNATASPGAGVLLANGGSVTNQSGGTITGYTGVYDQAAAATVVNAGHIGGNTASGRGIDLKAGGTITNQAGGTISGGADAVLFASSFSNRLVVDPGAAFIGTVDGGDIPGGALISTLELASGAAAGTLTGLGSQFIGFADTTIDAGATWTLSGTNTLVAGTTLSNGGTLTDTGTLFNSGTMTGDPIGLDGGALTNQAGGVLTATYIYGLAAGGTDTVANQGTITSATNAAIYLKASGSVSNAAGGVITGYNNGVRLNGTGASLSNLGQITGTGVALSYGVYMRNGGVVTNGQGGAGTSTASIQGYYGVGFKSSQTGIVTNDGTITGIGATGWGVWLSGNSGSVTNGPSGAADALIQGGRFGVYAAVGSVINDATIIATGAAGGDYGIEIEGSGSVGNLGTASLIEGYGGVQIQVDGTITNAGTIASNQGTAGVAVAFTAGDARLIDDPGAVFIGAINGGSGGTAVLELASGSSAGIVAGLGTAVTNFTSLVFDSGSAWTVAGNDSANGLGTLGIGGFTINDTIDLTGFVAVSRTFAGSTLTLTAAGGAHETLTFQGDFSTGNFAIGSDGNGGTDVTYIVVPQIAGSASGQPVGDEAAVLPFSGVTVSDANIGSQAETVTITLTSNGTVTGADGTLSGAGLTQTATGIYTLSAASAGAVTTALEALVFTPTAHQVAPGDTVTTGFTIQVTDTAGGTASDSTTTVIATAANDAPVIAGAVPGQTTTDETTITPLSDVSVSDVDFGQTETVTVTLSSTANGTLSDGDGGSFNSDTGVYSITGTDSTVTTALHALVFTPTAHQVAPGGTVTTTFTIQAADTAGATSSNGTTTVSATAANDPPVIAGAVPGQTTTDETTITPLSDVSVSDVDFGQTETVTVTLSSTANGTLSDGDGGSFNSDTGVYSITGTDSTVTTALQALVFTPTAHQVAPGGTVTTTFTIQATDTAGATSSNGTTTVSATAANDPPVIAGAVPGQTTTDETTITPLSDVSVSDVDFGQTETVTVTLSSTANGTLSDGDGGIFDSGTGIYSITGTDSAVTTALHALVFTPAAHQAAPGGTVTTTFTIQVTDTAGATSSNGTTTVIATAANDAPVIAGAVPGQTTTDETTITPLSDVSVSDVDFGQTETVTVTLSSTANGTLSDGDGGSFNSDTGVYSITGTDSTVTTALHALVFTPTAHQVAPGDTVTTGFTIQVTDTAGGTGSDSTTTVIATAANDAPVIAGAVPGQTTTDETTITPLSDVSVSDVDFGQTETVTVTLSSTANGTLSDGDGGIFDSGTGIYSITGTDSTVTTALQALVFTPAAHQVAPGGTVTTTFTIQATDTAGATSSNGTTTVSATAANDPPVIAGAVPGQTTTDETTITPLSDVSVSDVDFGQTETVTVTLSSTANGTLSDGDGGSFNSDTGVYSITGTDSTVTTALHALVFTPTAHQVAPGDTVTTGFTIQVTDTAGGTSSNGTTTVIATAANDPPVIAGAVPGQTTTDETTITPLSDVSVSDVDFGQTETVTVTLSSTANGTLSDGDGGSFNSGTGIYSITGTDSTVTTALQALVFTPTAHQVAPGDTVTTGFTIQVTDTAGGTGSNGTTTVSATAANDAPVIAGAVPGQTTTDETTITPLSDVSVSDVDFGQTETVTVTLSSIANGTLSDGDGGSFNSDTGVYSITGTDSTVTTALHALVFTPTAHQVAPGDTVTTGFTIQVTDTAGGTSSNGTTTVIATAANDAPVIAGAVPGQTTSDETTITPLSDVSVSDVDFGQTETVTVTLSSTANGTLSDGDGGSFNSDTGVYSITGTDSTVTTALHALVFTPTAHQVAPGGTVTTTFTIQATDTAGATSSNGTTTVSATAANDPPVIAGAVPGQTTTDETTITPLSDVSVSDVDFGQTETVTVTLSSTANGTLSDGDGGIFDSGTGIYSITGTDSTVTTALQALVFTPAAHQVAPGDTVTTGFTIQVTDTAGGTGSNGTTTVSATAANDAPVIAGAVPGQTTTDETTITPLSDVSVSDVDFGQTETVTVTLSSTANGTLSDGDGGSFNSGTGVYSITGTDSAVTTALQALVFTPTAHQVAPGDTVTTGFTIQVTDTAGGTGSNGTTTVSATAANDAPVIAGAVPGQTTTDETTITPLSDVSVSDVDFGQTETVTVTLSSTANGTLSDGDGGSFNSDTGVYSITGTDSAVTTALHALVFTPTAHQAAPGGTVTTTFTIQAADTAGGTGSNGTATVSATAVNDPPVITGTTASQPTTDETTVTPFSGVTISDPDFGASETVTITLTAGGLPSDANGTLSGAGLTRTGTGTYALAAGSPAAVTAALQALLFTPTSHEVVPGDTDTTGMTLSVSDGIAVSPTTDTTTSVVATAANDPPVITGTVAGQLINDDQTDRPFSTVTITDPDLDASETVTITLDVDGLPNDANGTLSGTGLTRTGTGTYTLAAGSPAAVTAALRALVFTPAVLDLPPDSSAVTEMALSVSDGIAGSPTTDTTTSVAIVPCFAAGTRIATPRGAIAVERLREADMVLTISGKPQPIQWIGRRTLDCNRHAAPERVKPIRIAPHAFGEDRPRRPLLLSPDHSVFVEDVFIPVRHLVNGTTVTQVDVATVTYYHIELPRHDVVLAEGLPAETYLETGARFAFENGGGALQLHPDFAPDEARVGMVWRNFSYAPLIGSDGQLDRVRARLALQALMLQQQFSAAPRRTSKRAKR